MQSKKMETIIKRIKTLNKEELERLSNVVEAEIIFRDTKMAWEDGLPDGVTNEELDREFSNV